MTQKSKLITGLKEVNANRKERNHFTDKEKHGIIQEFLSGNLTRNELWKKHTGQKCDHGHILQWMRVLGYNTKERVKLVSNSVEMKKKEKDDFGSESFETLQLKKRIEELEKQLKDAEMKAIAFSTMIDIAEKNLNIPIRKKVITKPLKK